jgi:outer membrane protein OmpA-like peptidoglycan-associated protein
VHRHAAVVVAVVLTAAVSTPAAATVATAPAQGSGAVPADLSPFVLDLDGGVRQLSLTTAALDGSTARTEDEATVDLVLAADVFFAFGQATLTPQAQAVLTGVAAQLQEQARGRVAVVGHTDSVGADAANLDLSRRRAQAVVAVLGPAVPGLELVAEGRGEAEPVAEERTADGADDPAGRARNRRVAITFDKA